MSTSNPDLSLLPLFDRALEEELGLWVGSRNGTKLRDELYAARKASANPAYDSLKIFLPATRDRVFIVKKSVEIEG